MATIIEYYEVFHADMMSGAGNLPSVAACFSSAALAKAYADKDKYLYMPSGPKTITIYDDLEEIVEARRKAAYKSALAKLTPDERAALGVLDHG